MNATRPTHWRRFMPATPPLLFLAIFFLFPVGQLLLLSVEDAQGAWSLANYRRIAAEAVYLDVLAITFKISGWTTLIAVAGALPVAVLLARASRERRNALLIWVLVPFWTSFLVRTFAWMILLGRNGPINQLIQLVGLADAPVQLVYNFTGTLTGMAHAMLPLAVMTMLPVMQAVNPDYGQAANTLGASASQRFWRIDLPQCLPGISAATMMVFISSLGFFITPALLGGARETMLSQVIITQIQELLNWRFASALSVLLLIATLAVFIVFDRLAGISSIAGQVRADGHRPTRFKRLLNAAGRHSFNLLGDGFDWLARVMHACLPAAIARRAAITLQRTAFVLIIAFLILPALLIIPASFTAGRAVTFIPQGLSLRWYETVFTSPEWMSAIVNSLAVGLAAAALALVLGTMAAFIVGRRRFIGKTPLLALILSPLIVPRIVTAVALFYLYSGIGLVGTLTGLAIGHAVLAIPYVTLTVMAVLATYDDRLDQAAATLGASTWQTLRRVTLPVIKAGLLSAFLFAFVTSFDDLTIALFVTGGAVSTLPRQLWSDLLLQINPTLAAVSTLVLVFMIVLLVVNEAIRRRR